MGGDSEGEAIVGILNKYFLKNLYRIHLTRLNASLSSGNSQVFILTCPFQNHTGNSKEYINNNNKTEE